MPKYTIASTNYNMAETIERSLKSILTQLDDRFEVLVVDDGSDDGSVDILRKLEDNFDRLRVKELERDPNRTLGETRNISIKESKGEYVLLHHDMDDEYMDGFFKDSVKIFHQIEEQIDFDFFLLGPNMAKKDLLLRIGGYRNLMWCHDKDLFRRLAAKSTLIPLKLYEKPMKEIGYSLDILSKIKRGFKQRYSELKSGLSFWGYFKWSILNSKKKFIWYSLALPIAYILLRIRRERMYDPPKGFGKKGSLEEKVPRLDLYEIEKKYNININSDSLSPNGKKLFLGK